MSGRLPVGAIVALGATQIIGYGTLYYSFSILAPDMAADLGWSQEWIFGALSVALLIGGFTAPWLGSLIDRIGAGRVMTIGSAAAAAALVACAFAPRSGGLRCRPDRHRGRRQPGAVRRRVRPVGPASAGRRAT